MKEGNFDEESPEGRICETAMPERMGGTGRKTWVAWKEVKDG